MKKIYLFLTALAFTLMGTVQSFAQDESECILTISNKTGAWTASGSPAYSSEYATTAQDPGVRIQHWNRSGGHNNNMCFTDGNLTMYSALGSTTSEDYRIYPTSGWYVSAISLDFVPYKHPDFNMNGVRVWANADESSAVTCPADYTEPAHYEMTDIPEAEFIPLTIGQLEEGGNPIFAIASNFTITLTARNPLDVILEECSELYSKYDPIMGSFVTGDKPGCYSEEAVSQLRAALNNFYEHEMDPDITLEQAKGFKADIENAVKAVEESKITVYDLAEGYYHIRTGLTYTTGDKYMLGNKTNASWGSIISDEETEPSAVNAVRALWKITKGEKGYIFVNMYRDGRVKDASPLALDAASTDEVLLEPVITIDDVTYTHMRTVSNAETDGKFFHQNSHGGGNGTGGTIVYWYDTHSYQSESFFFGASEWFFEPVSDDDAQQIIANYAPTKERELFVEKYVALRDEAKAAVKKAKDIQEYTDLITSAEQFSSPWSDSSEGTDFGALIDNDPKTYWHSDYHNGNVANHTHYLQVEMNESVYDLTQIKLTRRSGAANDHVTLWGVWGANDPGTPATYWQEGEELPEGVTVGDVKEEGTEGDWVELASLATPYGNNTETITSDEFDSKGYKYLRFWIDGTTTNRGYGHAGEFQIVVPVINPKSQFAYMGEVGTNLDNVLKKLMSVKDDEITQEQYDELVQAYDAFKAQFVDPQELRTLLVEVEGIAKGVKVGTQPGYWKDATLGEQLKATYNEAKAYDEEGIYIANKSNEFIQKLTEQSAAVKAAVIGIEEGKWYRIHFGSREEFEAQGWDLESNDASVNHEIQTNEALWDKYITAAKLEQEIVKVQDVPEEGEPTEIEITINHIVPIEAENVRRNASIFLDDDNDIEQKDLSLFRFVAVGDTAFVLQNKATGLFVKAAGNGYATSLDIIPSLFNVEAIGYGQNLIQANNLISNAKQYNLHAQRAQNRVVTYSESTPGSRSGLYIEEAGDVEDGYDGTLYTDTVHTGELYAHVYPVDFAVDEDNNDGSLYTVNSVAVDEENVTLSLAVMEKAPAGRPFIYIYGDPDEYDIQLAANEVKFRHGYEFVKEPTSGDILKGTFVREEIGAGFIVTGGNLKDLLGAHATDQVRNKFYITEKFITNTVLPFGAYISNEGSTLFENLGLDVVVEITDEPDHIAEALSNVAKSGAIYTIDGRLVSRNGNLNTLRKLGKGVYILNGTKVSVK